MSQMKLKTIVAYIAIIAVSGLIAACTTADQERIATTIAEDESVQDQLIAIGHVLETREAEYTPTPVSESTDQNSDAPKTDNNAGPPDFHLTVTAHAEECGTDPLEMSFECLTAGMRQ